MENLTAEEYYDKEINPDSAKFENEVIHKLIIKLMNGYAKQLETKSDDSYELGIKHFKQLLLVYVDELMDKHEDKTAYWHRDKLIDMIREPIETKTE